MSKWFCWKQNLWKETGRFVQYQNLMVVIHWGALANERNFTSCCKKNCRIQLMVLGKVWKFLHKDFMGFLAGTETESFFQAFLSKMQLYRNLSEWRKVLSEGKPGKSREAFKISCMWMVTALTPALWGYLCVFLECGDGIHTNPTFWRLPEVSRQNREKNMTAISNVRAQIN